MQTWVGKLLSDFGKLFSSATSWVVHDGGELFWTALLGIVVSTFAFGTIFLTYKSIAASGRVEYCMIEETWFHAKTEQYVQSQTERRQMFLIVGHREWRGDTRIAELPSLDMALAFIETDACHTK